MIEFVTSQAHNLKTPKCFFPNQPLGESAMKLNDALTRYEMDKLDLEPLMHSQAGKDLLKSTSYIEYFDKPVEESFKLLSNEINSIENNNLNDRVMIFHLLLVRARAKETSVDSPKVYTYSVLRTFLEFYLNGNEQTQEYFVNTIIAQLFVELNFWRELVLMCDLCFTMQTKEPGLTHEQVVHLEFLYKKLIRLFVEKLVDDLAKVDRKNRTCLVAMLTSLKITGKKHEKLFIF